MKKSIIMIFSLLIAINYTFAQTNTFPSSGNVGIGTTSPTKKLDIAGDGINLENTLHMNLNGVVFKEGKRFISNFNYGNNGTVTTVGYNTFVGIYAGNFTMGSTATTASQSSYNTAVGCETLYHNTTGYHNTAIGYRALYLNRNGHNNTAVGYVALNSNTSGTYNTAIGYEALYSNTSGDRNTANGYAALVQNTTGYDNTAIGFEALFHNTTGYYNTAIGYYSLLNNTTGSYNIAFGSNSLYNNTIGSENVAVGWSAIGYNIEGDENTAIGNKAGFTTSEGGNNDNPSNSVFIGARTKSLTTADNNEIVIGYNTIGAGSNSVVLGNSSVTKTLLQGNVGIGTTTPQSKLAVNGVVTAQKVKVTQSGWPDYVFDTTYRLASLNELKNFITHHKHLPEVPSAKEITYKGLNLGDMQKKQMQKIEELTLYIINMSEKIQSMKSKIDALKTQIIELKSKQ